MTRLSTLTVTAFLAAMFGNAALACSCLVPSTPTEHEYLQELESSEMVFVGTVTSDVVGKPQSITVTSEAIDFPTRLIQLRVEENFKGALGDVQEVTTGFCGFPFVVGTTYLVYASRDKNGGLSVSMCSFSKRYLSRTREIRVLRRAAKRARSADINPPSSNLSLERSVLAPRAVPAVPLKGCTAGTSTNGRFAAAQFNR